MIWWKSSQCYIFFMKVILLSKHSIYQRFAQDLYCKKSFCSWNNSRVRTPTLFWLNNNKKLSYLTKKKFLCNVKLVCKSSPYGTTNMSRAKKKNSSKLNLPHKTKTRNRLAVFPCCSFHSKANRYLGKSDKYWQKFIEMLWEKVALRLVPAATNITQP